MVASAIIGNRKIVAGIVVGVAALVFILLWFLSDGFSASVLDYINAHGGWSFIFLYAATLIVGILAYVFRDHKVLMAFAVILAFAAIASFLGAAL